MSSTYYSKRGSPCLACRHLQKLALQVALEAEEECEGHGTLVLPFSITPCSNRYLHSCKKEQQASVLLWFPSASPCPQPAHTLATQEGAGYPAVRTEGRFYKTIWSADKVHSTEEARDRSTCGIIQNCLKPPHHLQAPFISFPLPSFRFPPVTSNPLSFSSSLSLKPYFFLPAHLSTPSLSTPH